VTQLRNENYLNWLGKGFDLVRVYEKMITITQLVECKYEKWFISRQFIYYIARASVRFVYVM